MAGDAVKKEDPTFHGKGSGEGRLNIRDWVEAMTPKVNSSVAKW
jgi:hypothetical protein